MPFEPEKINATHVIEAARLVEADNRQLHASTGYDVIVSGKKYPPKEIIRIAHQLAVGTDPGRVYGGPRTNKHLSSLGFEIVQKIKLWKLGCNWGRGKPNFYEFIKQEKIVISVTNLEFSPGDLILVTEGFQVRAIARVKEQMQPVTSKNEYEEPFDQHEIYYEDSVLYAPVEWYELSETDSFVYELQAGIRKVQKKDVIELAINLWENRNVIFQQILFYVKTSNERALKNWVYPCLVMTKTSAEDDGFRTAFELWVYRDFNDFIFLGNVKILELKSLATMLPSEFKVLSDNYCSLGETLEYYRRVKTAFPDTFEQIFTALRDAAFAHDIQAAFWSEDGFQKSLLRSTEAQLALRDARSILAGTKQRNVFRFTFSCEVPGAVQPHIVDFSFNEDPMLSNRFICIIGKNGTGKTQVLAQLANKLTNTNSKEGDFIPDRPAFSKIIAASFSYFDKFKIPERHDSSYDFIGIRSSEGIFKDDQMGEIVWNAIKKIATDRRRFTIWQQAITGSLESDYLDFKLEEIISLSTRKEFMAKTDDIFSSGQKVVFQFITRCIAVIEDNSLLLFDEPETHLHPNIAGRLLRTIDSILKSFESFCIVSTHSPVIVQEIPSRYIRIFDRHDNYPDVFVPGIECFGENLSKISNTIFKTDQDTALYKITLQELSSQYSIEEIKEKFNDDLSLNAMLYLQTLRENKE